MIKFQFLLLLSVFFSSLAWGKTPIIEIKINNHLFSPSVVLVPVNTKVKLLLINEDETSEEFESYELNREKIIMGKQKAVIFIGPLAPGEYPFFGEFHPQTAQGKVIVEE